MPGAVPLFDGINFPDEPYRYVVPPAGYQKTPAPDHASGSAAVTGTTNSTTVYVNTDEQAPQINVVLPGGLLRVTSGATSVTVSAVPQAPDRQPSKGTIDGNVYRVTAIASAGIVTWSPPPGDAASASTMVLRATSARQPPPVFLYRAQPTLAWTVLPTAPTGNDVYRTQFAGFGDYALAFGVVVTSSPHSDAWAISLSVLLVVVLLAVAAVLVVRLRRRPV
ncbi:hypothetical protein acdb102_36130 [Acidothermaceae bacterium B102]|nr:hypothetical protein acdb102_36130 [Acidothermaceae bacterium B102]